MNYYIKDTPKSYLNHDTKDALLREKVRNRTHIGICCNEIDPYDEIVKKYDISKRYKSVMFDPNNDWMQVDFNSVVDNCDEYDNLFGLYFTETNDMTPLHKKN